MEMNEQNEINVDAQQQEAQPEVQQPVEQTQEPVTTPKTYTQDEVNEIIGRRLARRENRIRKDYDEKYGRIHDVLRAGTGKEDLDDIADSLLEFYGQRGVKVPDKPVYSERDEAILAKAEAEDIIRAGEEDVVEELERLAKLGAEKMSSRQKAVFQSLATHRQNTERNQQLSQLGVAEEVYNGKEFKEFASKFAPSTPVTDIYDIYSKLQPKKDIKPMGSMKNIESGDQGVKDFYTREEALKFTQKDLDKNPALYKAIVKSMEKW